MYYEVQRYGTTLEWETRFSRAKEAFDAAGKFGTVLYRIVGSKKYIVMEK